MASKRRRIPPEEWERHKETIRGLFHSNTLEQVMTEMKDKHGFVASKFQYETKLRDWGFRKKLKRTEWERLFVEDNNVEQLSAVTSSGLQKSQASINRAKRWVQTGSSHANATEQTSSSQPAPLQPVLPVQVPSDPGNQAAAPSIASTLAGSSQHFYGPTSPPSMGDNDEMSLPLFFNTVDSSGDALQSDLVADLFQTLSPAAMSFGGNWETTGPNPLRQSGFNNLASSSLASGSSPITMTINGPQWRSIADFTNGHSDLAVPSHPFGIEGAVPFPGLEPPPASDASAALGVLSPMNFFDDAIDFTPRWQNGELPMNLGPSALLHHSRSRSPSPYRTVMEAAVVQDCLKDLPFEMFENHLASLRVSITIGGQSIQMDRRDPFSFDLVGTSTLDHVPGAQNALQKLRAYLPAKIPGSPMETHTIMPEPITLLLFSIINGFVGLDHISTEDILGALGRLDIVDALFVKFLQKGPRHACRTLIDNIFWAAIEVQNERVVKLLLKNELVDINSTSRAHRRPLQRAAQLCALNLVRIFVENGADVRSPNMSVLYHLLLHASYKTMRDEGAVTVTSELVSVVDLLLEKGCGFTSDVLDTAARRFTTGELACLLSAHIEQVRDPDMLSYVGHAKFAKSLLRYLDDESVTTVVENMANFCRRTDCGCLFIPPREFFAAPQDYLGQRPGSKYALELEDLAVSGALQGHVRLTEFLLTNCIPPSPRVFCAAIRSGKSDLIRVVLSHNPNLNPDAEEIRLHVFRREEDEWVRRKADWTTPLAEAVKTRNAQLAERLRAAGAGQHLDRGGRLIALLCAVATVGDMPYLKSFLHLGHSISQEDLGQLLLIAIENGHREMATYLLAAGARADEALVPALRSRDIALVHDILSSDISGVTIGAYVEALNWADHRVISTLFAMFPYARPSSDVHEDTNFSDSFPRFYRHCAETNSAAFFETFLRNVTFVTTQDLTRCLAVAVELDDIKMVELLVHSGANPLHHRVLELAILKHPQIVPLLLGRQQQRAFIPKRIGIRVLQHFMTASTDNSDLLENILSNMEAFNLTRLEQIGHVHDDEFENEDNNYDKFTPLGLAIAWLPGERDSSITVIQRFLEADSDPNGIAMLETSELVSRHAYTAFTLAIKKGRRNVVELLLRYDADVNKEAHLSIKQTPLQCATMLGDLEMVRLLLKHGAIVNAKPAVRSGGTALQYAAISGNCNLAAELLENGAHLDAPPSKINGRWPLEGAAEHGRLDMIQFLWKCKTASGIVTGFEDRQCLRAMDFAEKHDHLGCRDLISELSGLSVDLPNSDNYGPEWLAY